ncbi:MAG: hypothetical protein EU535_01240 [Promethearchaeota archaeon]|nr:MAG: hypothetical protein EU535_01240 [Candidatus Lokiarchaeota archaeon]
MVKIKYAFCKYCDKEIHNPAKKPLDSMQKTIWIIISISTLGIGAIAYLIYNKYGRKKTYCPTCFSKLIYSSEPFEKPKLVDTLTAKQKVLAKVDKKKTVKKSQTKKVEKQKTKEEKEEDKIYCPFCGEELEEKVATCPFCAAPIKF